MGTPITQKLVELQGNPSNVRNICILAHVDHGKTTLADTLVASNGIISQRMAGTLRYMDSREDEQLRGITMKSSAISLQFNQDNQEYLINLIDSPGHIDFSSEVSTAVRLCDGAVILVDVIEGVCPQTHAVLRQAWLEKIKPVLVLNKLDRLILEWKMTPEEAYLHLQQVLEQVNAITGALFTSDILGKTSTDSTKTRKESESNFQQNDEKLYDWTSGVEEIDDSSLYFSPDLGNVIFASAMDGWGFGIDHFAELYSKKLGMNASVLKKTLWGDFYLEGKTKMIRKGAQSKGKKPLFVQFILENIWSVYDTIMVKRDKEKAEKIVKSLNLKILPRDVRHNDPRVQLKSVCSQWLRLSKAVLAMVVTLLPSPLQINPDRVEKLLCHSARRFDSLPAQTQQLKNDFISCSSADDAPCIIFVSKMFSVDRKSLPQNRQKPLTLEEMAERREQARSRHNEKLAALKSQENNSESTKTCTDNNTAETQLSMVSLLNEENKENKSESATKEQESDEVFIAFARVFSGKVKKGKKLYVLGPKHDPKKAMEDIEKGIEIDESLTVKDLASSNHITCFTVEDLFICMGREMEAVEEVPAGNVLGIGGLEDHILKTATISSVLACPAFTDMYFEASPIVRVAVEPKQAGDIKKLVKGMKLLNQADPCVQILVQSTGEHVIIAAGEVHLQKCLDDLQDRFAKIQVNRSSPIVPFRETIVRPPLVDMVNESIQDQNISSKTSSGEDKKTNELIELKTANKMCTMKVRAVSLPTDVAQLLDEKADLLKTLEQFSTAKLASAKDREDPQNVTKMNIDTYKALMEMKMKLIEMFKNAGTEWEGAIDQIWSFGPRRNGPNILLNKIPGYERPSVWTPLEKSKISTPAREFDYSVISGFQMATLSGPLCEEPLMGVCFIVEGWEMMGEIKGSTHEGTHSAGEIAEKQEKMDAKLASQSSENENHRPKDDKEPCVRDRQHIEDTALETVDSDEDTYADGAIEEDLGNNGDRIVTKREGYGPFTGQLMVTVKECCKKAFQSQPQRLMAAMYTCEIQATAEVLGKMYAVLGKRNGKILEEELREGTSVFNIKAALPVVESFGFAEEIRKRTSGLASPQLKFSHWEVVDVDPFWVPTTEEEYLHFGEKADSQNIGRKYMNNVRKRKGLHVDEKIVEHAEKQRTLTRNK